MTHLTIFVKAKDTGEPITRAKVVVTELAPELATAAAAGATKKGRQKPRGPAHTQSGNTAEGLTDADGRIGFDLDPGTYNVMADAFKTSYMEYVDLGNDDMEVTVRLDLGLELQTRNAGDVPVHGCRAGDIIILEAIAKVAQGTAVSYLWSLDEDELQEGDATQSLVHWDTIGAAGSRALHVIFSDTDGAGVTVVKQFSVRAQPPTRIAPTGPFPVTLTRADLNPTSDQVLWSAIRTAENRISFRRYSEFINRILCDDRGEVLRRHTAASSKLARQRNELYSPIYGMGAYELLKTATEVFLLLNSGVFFKPLDEDFDAVDEASRNGRFLNLGQVTALLADYMGGTSQLPYIQRVLLAAFPECDDDNTIFCSGLLTDRSENTLLMELIWTYWHKEAMVSQAMKAISLRFQNRRRNDGPDPLAHLEIAPLYPLNNLLWGYIQDELHRLSERRIAHELMHQYGLAHTFSDLRPAETRSKFLGAFQHLLIQIMQFYRQDDDTTVNADAFPLLNALREVHLLLAEGNHNQSFDLTVTSRAEMLMEMWMLSRRELREFLQSRAMVPYREPWMGAVDAMKRLQGWTDVSVAHFNELAEYEEEVLLSIRYGDWVDVNNPVQAANWARSWRPEILSIVHSIRTVTGLELRADLTPQQQGLLSAQPSMLINRRPPVTVLPPGQPADGLPRFRDRRALRRQLRP